MTKTQLTNLRVFPTPSFQEPLLSAGVRELGGKEIAFEKSLFLSYELEPLRSLRDTVKA